MILGLATSVAVHLLAVAFIPGPVPATEAEVKEELIQIDLFPLDYGAFGYEALALGVSKKEAEQLSQLSADAFAFAEQLPVGPVSARRVVFWPSREKINISTPGNVRIKFWVQPDGAVARLIFEQKLDASLDDYSARFVRGLRFEPLPEGKDYVEWGTIPLAFRPE